MAFYHDPRLQTNLQYHYLPTQELQQQRKQVRWVFARVSAGVMHILISLTPDTRTFHPHPPP